MRSIEKKEKMVYTSTEAQRDEFSRIFSAVCHGGKRIIITRHREEKVAVVPFRDYLRLQKLDEKKSREQAERLEEEHEEKISVRRLVAPRIATFPNKGEAKEQGGKGRTRNPVKRLAVIPGSRKGR